jgi:hypothetical protein
MSFLSVLGKIGKFALPFIPGVGPVADKVVNGVVSGLDIAGDLAGGAANQRAADRGAQAEHDLVRQRLEQERVGQANTQTMQNSQNRLGAEKARMGQIASADMLGSSKPPTDPRARLSGAGYMSPETIAMMRERAMSALQSGSDTPQLQGTGPTPTMPQGGGMDTFLRTLQGVGTGLGALQQSGILGQGDGKQAAVNAPADLEAIIFGNRDEDDPLLRRGN